MLEARGEADAPRGDVARLEQPVNRYAHLAPLFDERARLAPSHPRQAGLRSALITGYLPVAQHIARRCAHRGDSLDDLEQVATLGLIFAVDRFEPRLGYDFLAFAVPTITGEVRRHFRDRSRTIRVPRRISQLQASLYEATADLTQRLGRAPRPSELADALGVSREEVVEGLVAHGATHTSSLDDPLVGDERTGRTQLSALGRLDPHLDLIDDRLSVAPLLADLPDREQRILLLRFFHDCTQTEIAELTGISQMHVSRLLSRTLGQLRRRLAHPA
jgi:RNA polymerase sigma-B factor